MNDSCILYLRSCSELEMCQMDWVDHVILIRKQTSREVKMGVYRLSVKRSEQLTKATKTHVHANYLKK